MGIPQIQFKFTLKKHKVSVLRGENMKICEILHTHTFFFHPPLITTRDYVTNKYYKYGA